MPIIHLKQAHGLTLIELIMVIVIISILAVATLPSYKTQIQKTRRHAAQAIILDYQAQFERCFTKTFNYRHCIEPILTTRNSVFIPRGKNHYQISASATVDRYTITATATQHGSQADDTTATTSCSVLTVNQISTRKPQPCWQ